MCVYEKMTLPIRATYMYKLMMASVYHDAHAMENGKFEYRAIFKLFSILQYKNIPIIHGIAIAIVKKIAGVNRPLFQTAGPFHFERMVNFVRIRVILKSNLEQFKDKSRPVLNRSAFTLLPGSKNPHAANWTSLALIVLESQWWIQKRWRHPKHAPFQGPKCL